MVIIAKAGNYSTFVVPNENYFQLGLGLKDADPFTRLTSYLGKYDIKCTVCVAVL